MKIEQGKAYAGKDGTALLVIEITGNNARVRPVMSEIEDTVPLIEIEDWAMEEYDRDRGGT